MNPGETQPRQAQEDAELGEALHHRLSQLAARLQRLTGDAETHRAAAGESVTEAQLASDAFDEPSFSARAPQLPRTASDRPLPVAPSAPPARGEDFSGVDRIATALRDLDREHVTARAPQPSTDHQAAESRLRSIRERIEALKARHNDEPAAPPMSTPPARSTALPEPMERPRSRALDFNAAIEEIAARQRVIDGSSELPRPQPPTEPGTSYRSVEESRPAPSREMDDLRRRIDEMARKAERTPLRNPEPDFDRRPAADAGSGMTADLVAKLDEVKRAVGALERSPGLEALRVSHEVLERRLDDMARNAGGAEFSAVAQQLLHRLPSSERFDALAAEIDRLSERVSATDQSRVLSLIENRMSAFERQISGLQSSSGGPGGQRMEAEITGLRDAVEGLYRMMHNNGSPALARLEERLNQLSGRLESVLESAPRADSVTDLLGRLELIAARGESAPAALESLASEIAELRARERSELASLDRHIQTLAQRLDEMVDGAARGRESDELIARISALSGRLDEIADATPTSKSREELEQVEGQLAALTSQLEHSGSGLNRLEQQIGALMQRLEEVSSDQETLSAVQDNIARLESLVHDSEMRSGEAIQAAARDAVRELSGLGHTDSDAIRELKADLRELQSAASGNTRETGAAIDSVHDTLDRVVRRLGDLEADVRGHGPDADHDEDGHATAVRALQREATPQPRSAAPQQPAARETPIQPGDYRAEQQPAQPVSDRDRRADFIAAARRAAQAAAAEHGAIRRSSVLADQEEEDAERGPGPLARLGHAIGKHRRPILIAAAAVVLAIAAFQVAKPFLGSNNAPADEPVVEGNAVPEASPAAPVEAPAVEPEASASPAAAGSAAFIPPQGVVSPRAETPAASIAAPEVADPVAAIQAEAPPVAASETMYPMPDEVIGSVRLRVAAAAGDPAALYEVGARYADGNGVPRDLAEAAVWLERSAEAGLAVAQHRLAAQYEAGLGVAEDRAIAFEWYLAAAEQGNVQAMHNLGVMLSQGIDGDPDFTAAIEWFTAAAEHGIRDSQYNLGVIYARGIGVDQDMVESYRWFALAAAQGDSDAAARRDEIAGLLSADELATARAAVSAWSPQGAPASANMVEVPEGGWDGADEQVSVDDQQQLVMTIQNLLADHGFDPGPADGVAGPMTLDAVRAYQASIGVEPTGTISTQLLAALAN